MKTKKISANALAKRLANFLPNGIPKFIRAYDNGGTTADRYTVVFTGRAPNRNHHNNNPASVAFVPYIGMSSTPYHPQSICYHSESWPSVDRYKNAWGGVAMGRKHPTLGKHIPFSELPEDCRQVVIEHYKDLWKLNAENYQ